MNICNATKRAMSIGADTEIYNAALGLQLQWDGMEYTDFMSAWERLPWKPTPEALTSDAWEICT